MPAHTINRQEEVSTENWQTILTLAKNLNFANARLKPPLQNWLSCVIAIDWLTGKRINEILQLKRKDIVLTQTEIKLRFHVGKKKHKKAPIEQQPYQKVRTILHKAVPYIQEYLEEYDSQTISKDSYLFSANTPLRTRVVHTTFINGLGIEETRTYSYIDQPGYVKQEHARFWLNKVNQQLPTNQRIYFHYGRHSIGIKLAYQGKSALYIGRVLDETPRAALSYTEHAGGIDEEWTQETE